MRKTVSAMEARRRFGELLEDVYRGDEVIIERNGKPMAVLVSPAGYETVTAARAAALDMLPRAGDIAAPSEREANELAVEAARAARRDAARHGGTKARTRKTA